MLKLLVFTILVTQSPAEKSLSIGRYQIPGMSEVVHEDLGQRLPPWSGIPFAGLLLSIAILPLVAPEFWHRNYPVVSLVWALILAVPFVIAYKGAAIHEILHTYLNEYIPFIILLSALYIVAGGIYLKGTIIGTPKVNVAFLGVGTILASIIGTTGAAMVVLRPFLRANMYRKNRTFMVAFFIFLVANIGGALTPLGDPPLFLGFLHGVPFFWTLKLIPEFLLTAGLLLLIYYFLDRRHFVREEFDFTRVKREPLRLEGWYNIFGMAGILLFVLLSGVVDLGEVEILGVRAGVHDIVRDVGLIVIAAVSYIITPRIVHEENEFTWEPIKEVAYLFAGIFMTMIPVLAILRAGEHGSAAFIIRFVEKPADFFWVTGGLTSFLDNAPTYLTFLNTAIGKFYPGVHTAAGVKALLLDHELYLKAISMGAVFFGSMTYIGNAPNFMVRSIAEKSGTPMPGFFGYIFKYSLVFLLPVFILVSVIFF